MGYRGNRESSTIIGYKWVLFRAVGCKLVQAVLRAYTLVWGVTEGGWVLQREGVGATLRNIPHNSDK